MLAALALLGSWGCARQAAPTGGEMDQHPPQVVEVEPDTFATVEPFTDPVRFHMDKPMSEMPGEGTLDEAALVSPRTGEISVEHQRRGYEVHLEGGYREGYVYSVTLLPRIQDRWNLGLEEPYSLHFSTGGEFHETLLGGIVFDRLTGEEVGDVTVDIHRMDEEDAPPYTALAEEDGIFTHRFLPPGRYRLVAYEDMMGTGEPDFTDPQDTVEVELATATDTLVTEDLALLLPDTVPAVLATAEAEDSVTVRLDFDKHLDPDDPLDEVSAELRREDEEPAPGVDRILHPHQYDALLAEEAEAQREEEDPEDPPEAPPADPPEEEPEPPEQEEDPLPAETLYLRLDAPLEPEEVYEVVMDGVVSVNGVPGGGGEAAFVAPEPVEEDPEDPEDPDDPPDDEPP